MVTQGITSFGKLSVDYIQSTRLYQGIGSARGAIQAGLEKVFDVVFPRNPVTQHREFSFLPTSFENGLGSIYYNDVCPEEKIAAPSALTARVSTVFDKLIQECVRKDELQFEVRVMQDDKTVNAFCLPGGKIVITTAMIKKLEEDTPVNSLEDGEDQLFEKLTLEDKLAAVLGHEISHACAGHGRRSIQLKLISALAIKATAMTLAYYIKQKEEIAIKEEKEKLQEMGKSMTDEEEQELLEKAKSRSGQLKEFFEGIGNLIKYFSTLNHSRCHELEADKYGIKIASKAGYKAESAIWLQHKFLEMKGEKESEEKGWFMRMFSKSIDLFATHPPSIERLEANRMTVQTLIDEGLEAIYPQA